MNDQKAMGGVFPFNATSPSSRSRVRTGCITCRTRKVKCDEQKPYCFNCTRLARTCVYSGTPRKPPRSLHDGPTPTSSNSDTMPPMADFEMQHDPLMNDSIIASRNLFQEQYDFNRVQPSVGAPSLLGNVQQDYLTTTPVNPFILSVSGSDDSAVPQWQRMLDMYIAQESTDIPVDPILSEDTLLDAATLSGGSRFEYFLSDVEPPFISPFDSTTWKRIRPQIADLGSHTLAVAAAISCVQTLYEAENEGKDTTKAISLYYAAKIEHAKMLEDEQHEITTIFIATFLLCCFEIVAQHETVSITLKPDGALIERIELWASLGSPWPPLARRIAAWLQIFHAKALHLGGRGLLSAKLDSLLPNEEFPTPVTGILLPTDLLHPEATTAAIHESLSAPLFAFFASLQKISVQTSSLNRHHRSRGTESDEIEVDAIARDAEAKLNRLWEDRTGLLRLENSTTEAELSLHLSSSLAGQIAPLIALSTASYFAEVLYLTRAHGKHPADSSAAAKDARHQIRLIVERFEPYPNTTTSSSPSSRCSTLHHLSSGLLFPLFMFAVESRHATDLSWAVSQLRRIKNPVCHSDLVADLAQRLGEEQLRRAGERVDTRYFCLERFGGAAPPFL